MNLLDYKDDKMVIAPEALSLKPFEKVWKSNKDKSKSVKELAYVYFMVNKSNEFNFWQEDDEGKRSKEVITFIFGNNSKYKPTIAVLEAIKFYKEKVNPYSAGLLEDALTGADKARQYIKNVDWELTDDKGKFIYDPNKLRDLFLKLPEFDNVIQKLRNKVKQDEQEDGDKKRGSHKVGIYEGGEDDI
jgi:hypothetical protein